MQRNEIDRVNPSRNQNKLAVLIDELLNSDDVVVGVGYRIRSNNPQDNNKPWWVNVHPNEIDELILMLLEAKKRGIGHLVATLGSGEINAEFNLPGMVRVPPPRDHGAMLWREEPGPVIGGWQVNTLKHPEKGEYIRVVKGEREVWFQPEEPAA